MVPATLDSICWIWNVLADEKFFISVESWVIFAFGVLGFLGLRWEE